jgi:hypothetical protein
VPISDPVSLGPVRVDDHTRLAQITCATMYSVRSPLAKALALHSPLCTLGVYGSLTIPAHHCAHYAMGQDATWLHYP